MVKAKFVVLYVKTSMADAEVRDILRSYLRLIHPDVDSLFNALLTASLQSRKITVVETPSGMYVAPGEYEIKGETYEFLVSKEEGLKKVAEDILGVSRDPKINSIVNIVQVLLWVAILVLGYLGYKNEMLSGLVSYIMLLIMASLFVENLRKGYKKRRRVRASAPHHTSE